MLFRSGSEKGGLVVPFKEALSSNAYFQTLLTRSNEVKVADVKPLTVPSEGRPFCLFTLECRLPEKTR